MPSVFRHILIFAACLALAAGTMVRADILVLANGDRIKGTCERDVDGIITFKSDILGEIVVPSTRATVEYDLPLEERQKIAAAKKLEEEKKLAEAKAAEEKKKAEAARLAATQPKPPATPAPKPATPKPPEATDRSPKVEVASWSNRIEFGLTSQSGRKSKTDISLRTETNRRTPKSELRFLNRYTYGETDGKRSADSIVSELRYRRNMTRQFFIQANSRYERDTIKFMNCDFEQGVGAGTNVVSKKTLVIATGADAAYRYRSFLPKTAGATPKPDESTSVLNIFQDMRYTINSRFSLSQDLKAIVAPRNDNDYQFRFNAGLTGKLTKAFNITTRVELEYDRTQDEDMRYNQRITTTLGYVF